MSTMTDQKKKELSEQIRRAVESRVGERIISRLDDASIDKVEQMIVNDQEEELFKWFTENVHDFDTIVAEETKLVKERVNLMAQTLTTA